MDLSNLKNQKGGYPTPNNVCLETKNCLSSVDIFCLGLNLVLMEEAWAKKRSEDGVGR